MTRTRGILFALLALACCAAARADQIRLRSGVSVAPGPVLLSDIAELRGDAVQRYAQLIVEPDAVAAAGPRRRFEVSLDQVRAALEREGAHWGRLALSGKACVVRVAADAQSQPNADDEDDPEAQPAPEPVDLTGPPTVRRRVAALLTSLYGVEPQDLRLLFDERDAAFLATPEWGRRIDLQPNTTASSGRQSITVRIFEGERLIDTRTLRVDARIRRTVVRLSEGVSRGGAVGPGQATEQRLWIDPADESPVGSLDDALGMRARTRLEAGDILRRSDIEAPILVRRNEQVAVHCISGGVALRAKARAHDDARMGDLVECSMEGRRGAFTARVADRGVVVVNLDARTQEDHQ